MWKDRFEFLYKEDDDSEDEDEVRAGRGRDFVFPLVLHPDTSGMAHVIGMIDRTIGWLKSKGEEVVFVKYGDCADEWKGKQEI